MATHSSILAYRIPWTEEPGRLELATVGYSLQGHKELDINKATQHTHVHQVHICREGISYLGADRVLRVRHDRSTSLSLFIFMHWRRKWQPTPVFLPRESQGWGSLVGCQLWGRTESDTTEATQQQQQQGVIISPTTLHLYLRLTWPSSALFSYQSAMN